MGSYVVTRSISIDAPLTSVHRLIDSLPDWPQWSPWEKLDPAMKRTFGGPASGVGASTEWSGNRKAGAGSMTITDSAPDRVVLDLIFTRPFKSASVTRFDLAESPSGGTEARWTMTGEQRGLQAIFGKIVPMDKLIGKDFEEGLANLKRVAERLADESSRS